MFTIFATSGVGGRQQIGAATGFHQRPEGAIHARAGQALVCRWRRSSTTGKLECVWGSELSAGSVAIPDRRLSTPETVASDRQPFQPEASLAQS